MSKKGEDRLMGCPILGEDRLRRCAIKIDKAFLLENESPWNDEFLQNIF